MIVLGSGKLLASQMMGMLKLQGEIWNEEKRSAVKVVRSEGDEAIGHVSSYLLWELVLMAEEDGVHAGVATWYALGKVTNFIAIRVGPSCLVSLGWQ
jgi:hypothetical protein